ncbi:MAG: FxDxF family PEP-CTERM protein [Pseudomonadota bacterium]|nr:FxDxF family PEP-CTERM protein [Pseudomonadota bacterium]
MIAKLLASAVLATGLIGSSAAMAADITNNYTIVLNNGTKDFGDTFAASAQGKTFDDIFSVTFTSLSNLTSALISIKGDVADLDLTGFNLIPPSGPTVVGTQLSTGYLDAWALAGTSFMPGVYKLEVLGKVVGAGGSYGGNVNVSPVPEPGALGMMVAGLGLLGVALSRRKKSDDSFTG